MLNAGIHVQQRPAHKMLACLETTAGSRVIEVTEVPVEIDQLAAFKDAIRDIPQSSFAPLPGLFRPVSPFYAQCCSADPDRPGPIVVKDAASARSSVDRFTTQPARKSVYMCHHIPGSGRAGWCSATEVLPFTCLFAGPRMLSRRDCTGAREPSLARAVRERGNLYP